MIAKVNFSPNISRSLSYGGNELKGGEIFLQSGYITDLSPEENAARWERMSNDYRSKAVHVILSFGDKDTQILRGMTESDRIKMEQDMLREFMDVLGEKGNNVKACPFVCFHHGNTGHDHLHLYVLMTTWEGKRLSTDFIGKNADRAAARVSILWNMEGPIRAVKSEWRHMLKTGAATEDNMSDQLREYYSRPRAKRHHEWSANQDVINERLRRKQTVEEANRRKKKCAFIITEAAKNSKDRIEFTEKLKEQGLLFSLGAGKGFSVSVYENERMYTYTFKQLDIDQGIVPYFEGYGTQAPREEWEQKNPKTEDKAGHRHVQSHPVKSAAQGERSRGNASRPMPRPRGLANDTGSSNENREYEVGKNEDYEESVRNESQIKM